MHITLGYPADDMPLKRIVPFALNVTSTSNAPLVAKPAGNIADGTNPFM